MPGWCATTIWLCATIQDVRAIWSLLLLQHCRVQLYYVGSTRKRSYLGERGEVGPIFALEGANVIGGYGYVKEGKSSMRRKNVNAPDGIHWVERTPAKKGHLFEVGPNNLFSRVRCLQEWILPISHPIFISRCTMFKKWLHFTGNNAQSKGSVRNLRTRRRKSKKYVWP